MARTKPQTAAVQPSKGSKITFGDDEDDFESQEIEAGPSRRTSRREPSSEPESDDDDEAPEAVGVSKSAVEGDAIASAAETLAQYVCPPPILYPWTNAIDNQELEKKLLGLGIKR
jgi:hypothetical protein